MAWRPTTSPAAPGIYFNQDLGYLSHELDVLKDYTFWLTEYREMPNFYYRFDM